MVARSLSPRKRQSYQRWHGAAIAAAKIDSGRPWAIFGQGQGIGALYDRSLWRRSGGSPDKMGLIRTAVVGVGHFGQHHAEKLSRVDGATLVAVADIDGGR